MKSAEQLRKDLADLRADYRAAKRDYADAKVEVQDLRLSIRVVQEELERAEQRDSYVLKNRIKHLL